MRRACLIVALLALAGLVTVPALAQQNPRAGDPNPLEGQEWFVDFTRGVAFQKFEAAVRQGNEEHARLLAKIAFQPQFKLFGEYDSRRYGSAARAVSQYLDRVQAEQPGSVALLTTLRHVGDECRPGYLAGGPAEDARTRGWFKSFAEGVGSSRVVIAFEPDSLGTLECLAKSRRRARLRTLAYGVDVLSKLPNATVYLEAGASDWEGAPAMSRKLRAIGVRKVRGFMLNVVHKDFTAANIRYGRAVSKRIGGKHFVINTSQNGNGPLHKRFPNGKRQVIWCNAPNAALGERPTTKTADPLVDAYLWISRPGFSSGPCNGGPPAGQWWQERALQLARRAAY